MATGTGGREEELRRGRGGLIKSLCQLDELWNEGEDHSLGSNGGDVDKYRGVVKQRDRMRGEKEVMNRERNRWRGMNLKRQEG